MKSTKLLAAAFLFVPAILLQTTSFPAIAEAQETELEVAQEERRQILIEIDSEKHDQGWLDLHIGVARTHYDKYVVIFNETHDEYTEIFTPSLDSIRNDWNAIYENPTPEQIEAFKKKHPEVELKSVEVPGKDGGKTEIKWTIARISGKDAAEIENKLRGKLGKMNAIKEYFERQRGKIDGLQKRIDESTLKEEGLRKELGAVEAKIAGLS